MKNILKRKSKKAEVEQPAFRSPHTVVSFRKARANMLKGLASKFGYKCARNPVRKHGPKVREANLAKLHAANHSAAMRKNKERCKAFQRSRIETARVKLCESTCLRMEG